MTTNLLRKRTIEKFQIFEKDQFLSIHRWIDLFAKNPNKTLGLYGIKVFKKK